MHPDFVPWIEGFWTAFALIWVLAAFGTKREVRRQSGSSRLVQVGLSVAAGLLLFDPYLNIGFLRLRLSPDSTLLAYAGIVMTAAGMAFAGWARFVLGGNWSGRVTIKQDHELVERGPYALVRHPIYSGMLLALLGTAICLGEFRAFLAFVLVTVSFSLKYHTEEAFMLQQFGSQCREYRLRTKALIPFVL